MNRRNFIANSLKGAVVPLFMGGSGLARATASFLPAGVCNYNGRTLVVIHLIGANDVINSAVPLSQFGEYQAQRPTIYIPQNKLITLDNNLPDAQKLGLNPGLAAFKSLYDAGSLSIVQRAGYPSPNRSHFAAESIWLRGVQGDSPNNDINDEGWIGRFLRDRYPSYKGLPFGNESDPLAIMLGAGSTAGFHTNEEHDFHLNLTGQDPAGFYNIISSLSGEPITAFPNSDQGEMLQYISGVEKSTQIYSQRVSSVFNAGTNTKTYTNTSIANQLKTIARFLAGGSTTKVFFGRMGGWDTHVNQVNAADTSTGGHTNLLADLSGALKTFQDDLTTLGIADRVTTVVFSEFGRKIIQSASVGTDHGTLSSMFVVGKHVLPGVVGNCINLSDRDNQGAPNPSQLTNDYRGVFSSILRDWLGASNASIQAAFPTTASTILRGGPALVKTDQKVDAACYFNAVQTVKVQLKAQIFLEGYLDTTTGKMRTQLSAKNLLPKTQPFGNAAFSYYGTEEVTTFPVGTVDWVFCELRNRNNFYTVARQPLLIREDGWLMDIKGNTTISFANLYPESYHLAIFHRSHIGILTTETTLADTTQITTFLINDTTKARGTNQLKTVAGKTVLVAGDTNNDGNINSEDYRYLTHNKNQVGYLTTDFNGDGETTVVGDSPLFESNRSRLGLPELFTKLKL